VKGTITKLTVQGFKSFNKKISIPLVNGFNIFCGPNGVGKSNVIDAICFVLGRTSAKSLRADRLHELIFHGGSGGKAAADYAAVTMYIDNTDKQFGFDDPEVSVTRKVNRKGVSIYKIQGKTTTREKVLQLLSSAMIYPDGHNIVMQGDITNVIEMNPVERRYIIDEVSGIADYNERKDKAQKDLDIVDQKLKEAEIIITERYDIFKKLEDERNAALRFQTLQNELQLLKASLAYKKLTEYQKTDEDIIKEIAQKEDESKKIEQEIQQIETDLENRQKGMQQLVGRLIDMSKHVEEEKEISFFRTKILMNRDRIDADRNEIDRLSSMLARLQDMESRQDTGSIPRPARIILEQKISGVHGIVSNIIKIPEKYQAAIEIAAGSHINDIIVDTDDTAKSCIDFLKREKIGRATFLPLNKIKPRELADDSRMVKNQNGVFGVASDLVKFDQKYEAAVRFVLGGTIVIDSLETARKIGIGKARMVTLDGDLVERSGAMIGGYYIRTRQKIATASDEISEYQQLRGKLESEIQQLTQEIEKFEARLKEYEKSEATKQLIDTEKLKIDSEDQLDKLRQNRKIAYEKKLQAQTELNRLNIYKAKIDAELENVKIEIQQYGQLEEIEKKIIDNAISTLQTKVRTVEREFATLGPVNFKAIEQYDKFKNEFDEYKRKYEKILEEKKAVMEMIEKIEEKRRQVFYGCLQVVSKYFDEIFKRMTNGNASIELENPMDLESGLLIQANPAGKKLLNLDSMSGGEKTLTALAFLFSVQKYRPTPFYMLDEIDAALDKENSKKVAELIKVMSSEAQFLMITHNDTTIKYGDVVYGVTMEAGESKIIGIELPKE
jgi:chromosome segregation protein